jgi:hypothetical protein
MSTLRVVSNLNRFLFGKQFSMKVKDSHLVRNRFGGCL